ncbi:GNAT family N-acetyltransferase [Inquilinus limosus]|uniref:GNAT family N-acetyltransferase n=1 Tax=Inquilinus limosus TaxID=171674 RepID=UPI00042509A4|nr:GNAT family N-acetyltransferase [Inquilinus limosus]
MTALPLHRRPVPEGPVDDALISFIEAHPLPSPPFEPRWGLDRLVLGPGSIIDAVDAEGRRIAIAAVVDACSNAGNAASLVVLCFRPQSDHDALARFLLEEAEAITAAGPRDRLEVEAEDLFLGRGPELEARGYREAYRMHLMRRPLDTAPPPVPPLPEGLRWAPPTEATMRSQHDAVCRAMAPVPGASIPDFESFAARARAMPDQHGLILRGDDVVGFLRVHPPKAAGGEGDVALIGRHPDHRGGGLGDILVAESLRRLHAAGAGSAALTVAAANDAALALYRRHGFTVAETVPVYVKECPANP